jgi:penicillin-binding protein 1A
MDNLVPQDIDLAPMALGALTDGVTPLEMTGAYQMFANAAFSQSPTATPR